MRTIKTIPLISVLGTALVVVCLHVVVAAQDKPPQRVRFERGKSSATIRGHINGYDVQDYVVSAKAGQQMSILITGSNPETYFVLYTINGRATDMSEMDHYSFQTTESGDYVIRVLMMRSAARRKGASSNYALTISIK